MDSVLSAMHGCDRELDQVLALLAASGVDAPEDLSVGEGDRVLLDLLWQVMGQPLMVTLRCPNCDAFSVVEIRPDVMPRLEPRCAWWGPGGGLREPTYADLAGLPADPEAAASELLRRCTIGRPPRPAAVDDLERVDQSLGPIEGPCAACGWQLQTPVEVEQLVLRRLARRAQEVDLEIHLLAQAYGWELTTIEALPDGRRRRLAGFVADAR